MKYVSRIETASGERLSLIGQSNRFEKGTRVFITDTETGVTAPVANKRVRDLDCLGVAGDVASFSTAIVRYDKVSATLYKYVNEAYSCIGTDGVVFQGADNLAGQSVAKADGNTRIVIATSQDKYRACGKFGSVVAKQTGYNGQVSICTLYDLLGMLCRKYEMNLMSYEVIQLYSKLSSYTTTLKLSRSPEAMRFFMKMYLNVTGGSHAVHI